jgi:hypothetical protein
LSDLQEIKVLRVLKVLKDKLVKRAQMAFKDYVVKRVMRDKMALQVQMERMA